MLVYVANYDYGLGRRMEVYADFNSVVKAIQEKADNHTKMKKLPAMLSLRADFTPSKQNDTWVMLMHPKYDKDDSKATVFGTIKMMELQQ